MASYLSEVKEQLEDLHMTLFDKAWRDVVEPALKQSYKNGVADGSKGGGSSSRKSSSRSRWSSSRDEKEEGSAT